MLFLLAVLSFITSNEGFSLSSRGAVRGSFAVPTARFTELTAVAKSNKEDTATPKKTAKKTSTKEKVGEREEMMIDVLASTIELLRTGSGNSQLMDMLDDMEGKGLGEMGGRSSSLSSDQTELLNGVLRIYCTHSQPNFGMPWQRMKQEFSTSTGFVIDGNRILTNAHAVEYGSLIQVKKRSSEKKYVASVIAGKCSVITIFFVVEIYIFNYSIPTY